MKPRAMELYKVLDTDGSARMGVGSWHLPKGKRPGKWMEPIKGRLKPCSNGYHLCRKQDLIHWLGPRIFVAEYRGDELVESDDKVVVREARLVRELHWNDTTARLFAADCAEHTLHIFEEVCPDDKRPAEAIEAARKFARGEITQDELAAARAAAWAAAWDAAGAAARAAARDAARAAAWAAAWDAAWDAAGDAAGDAEREWQTARLFQYLNGELA